MHIFQLIGQKAWLFFVGDLGVSKRQTPNQEHKTFAKEGVQLVDLPLLGAKSPLDSGVSSPQGMLVPQFHTKMGWRNCLSLRRKGHHQSKITWFLPVVTFHIHSGASSDRFIY